MSITIQLTSENTKTIIGAYNLGSKFARVKHSPDRGKVKLAVFLDEIPADSTEEEINKILSQYKMVIG